MDRTLYGLLSLLSPVFDAASHVPWIGFVFYLVGLKQAVTGRFSYFWLVIFSNLCFFSPNIALMIQDKLELLSDKVLR